VRRLGLELELGVERAEDADGARKHNGDGERSRDVHRVKEVQDRREGDARKARNEQVVLVVRCVEVLFDHHRRRQDEAGGVCAHESAERLQPDALIDDTAATKGQGSLDGRLALDERRLDGGRRFEGLSGAEQSDREEKELHIYIICI